MIVIEGSGTISVTEPGSDRKSYYEDAEIKVFGAIVHFLAYSKYKTAPLAQCVISWAEAPTVKETGGD